MDEQNNQNEQQMLMDQQTGLEKMAEQGAHMAGQAVGGAAKEVGKDVAKKGSKALLEVLKKFMWFIVANLFWILGALVIIIIMVYILQIVGGFTNLFNGSNKKGITDTKAYITSDENGIILSSDNDIKEGIKEVLKEQGIKKIEDLGLGKEEEAMEYLLKFYKTTMATQLPYIPGVEQISNKYVQGMVHIKRTKTSVEEARDLTWMGYKEFKEKLEAEEADESLLNYYSIDENWNLCVAIFTETQTNGVRETYKILETKIPYQTLISQYSVPLRFVITMQQITQNPEYISKMCDMFVEGKQIDFTIFDSIETTTYINTYSHSTMHKWTEEVEREYELENDQGETTSFTSTVTEHKRSGPTEQPDEVTETTTITNTITGNVTYARTWLLELKDNYENESTTEYPLGENGQTTGPEDEEEPGGDEGTWRVNQYWNMKQIVDKNTWKKVESEPVQIKESEFLGLWRNEKGEYELGADFKSEKNGGKLVYYKVPNSREKQTPMINIYQMKSFLFKILEDDETTQNYANIMKYLLYKYDGKDYGVTELDLSIFETKEFIQYTAGVVGGNFEEKVWFTLINAGYSEYAVAGAMGNFYKESGFKSNNLQNTGNKALGMSDEEYTAKVNSGEYARDTFIHDKYGYGLGQWTYYSRKAGLYDYAKQKGVGIEDENMQIEYVLQEVAGAYPDWENATSVEEAATVFCKQFENPNPAQADLPTRISMAEAYYQKYSGKKQWSPEGGSFEGGSTIGVRCPRYNQSDPRWGNTPTARPGKTISSSGCGTSALAMGVSGLTGNTITPDMIEETLRANNITTYANGATASQIIASKYGLTYEYIDRTNKARIDAALDAGKVLIFSIKANGIYTGAGHFIMCVGRQDNNYYVLESGHCYETDRPYAFNQVFTRGNQGIFALGR